MGVGGRWWALEQGLYQEAAGEGSRRQMGAGGRVDKEKGWGWRCGY